MELVYLEWEDASSVDTESGWVFRENLKPATPHLFRQVGFVVEIDAHAVVLTEAYNDDQLAPRSRIPLGMVKRWVYLDKAVK